MALPTLSSRIPLHALRDEIVYTLTRLQAHSATAKYAASFDTLLAECKKAQTSELTLYESILKTEAMVDAIDDELDDAVDVLHVELLKITQSNRKDVLYQRYFGAASPSLVKRPILGEELEQVRGWLDSLKASPHAELQSLAKQFETIVKKADQTLSSLREARAKYTDFRQTAAREALFRSVNAQRKSTYGELGKLAHETVFKQSNGFADRFFLHERGKKRPDPESSAEVKAQIEEAESNLQRIRDRYEFIRTQEETAARINKEYEEQLKALDDAEKAAQEAAKRVAEFKRKIPKG